ncbi:MAG: 30S ribosomal protein S13 [Legionellales bacterium]|nr:30S ribosomal protein S13 [Legionellales bacterium]
MSNAATGQNVRIEGVNLPPNAHIVIGLQSIYGIGATRAKQICEKTGIAENKKVRELGEDDIRSILSALEGYVVEGNLRRELAMRIKRLRDIRCYRGVRHSRRLPARGQRTRTNAKSARGRRKSGSAGSASDKK